MPKDKPPKLYAQRYEGSRPKRPPQKRPKSQRKSKRSHSHRTIFGFLFKSLLVLFIWGSIILGFSLIWFTYDLPDIDKLQMAVRKPSVTITTQEGKILATYGDLFEDMVKVQDLPPYVPQAVLAIEDHRFYSHFGIDVIGLVRAAYTNWRADRIVQGGSSITQQLSKNFLITQKLYGVHDRSLRRKVQEAIMAMWLEWHFTKEQILTIYLNRVYFGSGTYGVDAASRKYFGKSAKNMTVVEAAILAGLLKAPSKYSPSLHPDRALARAKIVMQQMVEAGFLKDTESYVHQYQQEMAQAKPTDDPRGIRFFTDWIYEEVPTYVSAADRDLIVTTTLDPRLQDMAEKSVKEKWDEMGKALKVGEMGLVTMTTDGAVKALVGGVDYSSNQFNHVTQALRQPGSTFKMFIFLAALEAGLSPDTLIEDTPFVIGNWAPRNFRKYQALGEIPMIQGFAKSVNAVSIRLAMFVGPERIATLAHRLGITSKMGRDLSIALGTFECTLLDLTAAFATLANRGMAVWPYGITEIKDKEGNILYKRQPSAEKRLIAPQHLRDMLKMMQACVNEGTGRAAKIGVPVAGKTGSNGDLDAYFIGFPMGGFITSIWAGNDKNEPMKKESMGGRLPAITWAAYNKRIIADYPPNPIAMEEPDTPSDTPPVERLSDLTRNRDNFDDMSEEDSRTLENLITDSVEDGAP